MKKLRTVSHLLYAHEVDMGGMPVRQPFPTQNVQQIDPFLLLHHAEMKIPESFIPKKSGVGPHPHRGFSPVTFVYKGGVHHRDSRGNSSVIYAGGTQWMNAGRGIVHSERPPADIFDHGGTMEIIQLWINNPIAHKMDQPAYHPLTAEDTPSLASEDGKVQIHVVAGNFQEVKGPIPALSPLVALRISFEEGGKYSFPVPADWNMFFYALSGKFKVSGYGVVEGKHALHFAKDGEGIEVEALEAFDGIILAGEPLDEPVVSQGPFVMNTQTQIMQAMRDYQMGKMGVLIED